MSNLIKNNEEGVPFLAESSGEEHFIQMPESKLQSSRCYDRASTPRRLLYLARSGTMAHGFLACLLLANMALIVFNYSIGTFSATTHRDVAVPDRTEFPFSPADEAVQHVLKATDFRAGHSPYSGKPRPAFDEAWKDLLYYTLVEVTGDELRAANKTTVKLKGNDKYLGYLEAFHQLHCVKRMIQMRYPESYPDLQARGKLSEGHFHHCIEVLRRGVMCRADTTLNTFEWSPSSDHNLHGDSFAAKKCVNWDRITEWAKARFPGEHWEVLVEDGVGVSGPLD